MYIYVHTTRSHPHKVNVQPHSVAVYICMYTYIHTYIHVYIYVHRARSHPHKVNVQPHSVAIYICIHTCIHTYIHVYIYVHRARSHPHKVNIQTPFCRNIYMYIHIHIFIRIYIYTHMYTRHSHTHTHIRSLLQKRLPRCRWKPGTSVGVSSKHQTKTGKPFLLEVAYVSAAKSMCKLILSPYTYVYTYIFIHTYIHMYIYVYMTLTHPHKVDVQFHSVAIFERHIYIRKKTLHFSKKAQYSFERALHCILAISFCRRARKSTPISAYVYIYIYIYISIYLYVCICIYRYMRIYIHTCMYIHIFMYIYTYMNIVCIYICI